MLLTCSNHSIFWSRSRKHAAPKTPSTHWCLLMDFLKEFCCNLPSTPEDILGRKKYPKPCLPWMGLMYKSTFQIKSFATFYKYAVTPYVRTTEFILTSVKCMRISLSLEKKKYSAFYKGKFEHREGINWIWFLQM